MEAAGFPFERRLGIGRVAITVVIVIIVVGVLGAGLMLSATTTSYTSSSYTSIYSSSSSPSSSLQSATDLENGNAVCLSVDGLPDPSCTPGATNANVTQDNIDSTICLSGWTSTIRPPESYTEPLKIASVKDYGYSDTNLGDYEEDHLISLELGGNPTSVYNLWAEPHYGGYGSYMKDALENYLNAQVCDGRMPLAVAQQDIATNWVYYWKQYVNTSHSYSSSSSSSSQGSSSYYSSSSVTSSTTSPAGSYSVAITYAQNPIVRGNYQTIFVTVKQGGSPVPSLAVNFHVLYASGSTTKDYGTSTNATGVARYNWLIGSNSDPGTFSVTATVNGQPYESSFMVTNATA